VTPTRRPGRGRQGGDPNGGGLPFGVEAFTPGALGGIHRKLTGGAVGEGGCPGPGFPLHSPVVSQEENPAASLRHCAGLTTGAPHAPSLPPVPLPKVAQNGGVGGSEGLRKGFWTVPGRIWTVVVACLQKMVLSGLCLVAVLMRQVCLTMCDWPFLLRLFSRRQVPCFLGFGRKARRWYTDFAPYRHV